MGRTSLRLLGSDKQFVDAELEDQITPGDLGQWKLQWLPYQPPVAANSPPNEHSRWNWRAKELERRGLIAHQGFVIRCQGVLQGLMLTDNTRECQIKTQTGKPLIYVEFLESAPWNRQTVVASVRFRGVGSALLRAAVELSLHDEFQGRIGLHSLPQARAWYARLGMSDMGVETTGPCRGLYYFEMTPAQAQVFLGD